MAVVSNLRYLPFWSFLVMVYRVSILRWLVKKHRLCDQGLASLLAKRRLGVRTVSRRPGAGWFLQRFGHFQSITATLVDLYTNICRRCKQHYTVDHCRTDILFCRSETYMKYDWIYVYTYTVYVYRVYIFFVFYTCICFFFLNKHQFSKTLLYSAASKDRVGNNFTGHRRHFQGFQNIGFQQIGCSG